MGWKGTMRSVNAAVKAAERDAKRRQRELEKRQKELQKMQAIERATFEVEQYENYIEVIQSVHKETSGYSWQSLSNVKMPEEPRNACLRETKAQNEIDNYSPGFFEKLLGKTELKRNELNSKLKNAIKLDKEEYEKTVSIWQEETKEYNQIKACFEGLKNGDRMAYKEWITNIQPFKEIEGLGTRVSLDFEPQSIIVSIVGNSIEVVPELSKSLLKTGKLSEKKLSATKRNEIYQDHLVSCSLRVARELFETLPIERLIINTECKLLNTSTGYMEDSVILSVLYVRDTLEGLNYEMIDPSDSLVNFVHNMKFKKTKGFEAVEKVSVEKVVS